MYVLKNSLRNVFRNKGRSVLTGIIVIVIAFSSCIALSIRQAAESAKADALEGLSITAQISLDRSAMMDKAKQDADSGDSDSTDESEKNVDKTQFAEMMNGSELSVEEMQKYAKAESVSDFYYTLTASVNADGTEAVQSSSSMKNTSSDNEDDSASTESKSDNKTSGQNGQMQPGRDMGGGPGMGTQGDFTIKGYSSKSAMTDFTDGTSKITSGTLFDESSDAAECIISEELAEYNNISVGDTIKITNPNDEDETYELTVTGIYENSSSGVQSGGNMGFSTSLDPANEIYMNYTSLKAIIDKSADGATTTTNDMGFEQSSAIMAQTSGTYVFSDVEAYEKFEEEARELGLSDEYVISSSDLSRYEQSLVPLETLSTIAGWFLLVILVIGAVILIVINIFAVRERKYEIGVLTAIGMKKRKVAAQFIAEIMVVTMLAAIIGGASGAVASVPVTNALLQTQVTAAQEESEQQMQNFGGPGGQQAPQSDSSETKTDSSSKTQSDDNSSEDKAPGGFGAVNYISEVSSAVNLTVLLEMLGICVVLAGLGSAVSVTAIMRYEPLKILSNRD